MTAHSAVMASASGQSSAARSRCGTHVVQSRANALTAVAKRRYGIEAYGAVVHAALHRVAHDPKLLHALSVGALKTARVEAGRQLVQHTVRIRIVRGSRVLVDANPSSFAVAGASAQLRDRGKALGRAEVSIQDVVGFIKLVHKHHPADVLVRGQQGQVKTSLPAAERRRLPASGCLSVAGRTYAVRSFQRAGFAGERLNIWVLV